MALDQQKVREILEKGKPFPELIPNHRESVPLLLELLCDQGASQEMKFVTNRPGRPRNYGIGFLDFMKAEGKVKKSLSISEQAMKALKMIGENAVPKLIGALSHENGVLRKHALAVLIDILEDDSVVIRISVDANKAGGNPQAAGIVHGIHQQMRGSDTLLEEVRSELRSFVDMAIASGDTGSIKNARNDARASYIRIAVAVKSSKRKILPDGEILSKETIKPPKGSKEGGMFRNVSDSNLRKTRCCG